MKYQVIISDCRSEFFCHYEKIQHDVTRNDIERNMATKDKAKPPFIPSIPVSERDKNQILLRQRKGIEKQMRFVFACFLVLWIVFGLLA